MKTEGLNSILETYMVEREQQPYIKLTIPHYYFVVTLKQ